MGLDVSLKALRPVEVYNANITHNLGKMAKAAGIYQHLWRPEELEITHAVQLVLPLKSAIKKMRADPKRFKKFDSPNGWGTYNDFVPWLERLYEACKKDPDAELSIWR